MGRILSARKSKRSTLRDRPKTKHVLDPRENKYQFAKYIERTEGVQILGGGLGNFG